MSHLEKEVKNISWEMFFFKDPFFNPAVVAYVVKAAGLSHSVNQPPLQTVDRIPHGVTILIAPK